MITITKRPVIFFGGLIVMLAVVAVVAALALMGRQSQESLAMHTGHESSRTDFSNDRKLVGFADNVFFGTVISEDGQTLEYGWPETQYSVRILETLKGTAEVGSVLTVNEAGGTYEDGTPYRLEGDHNMLKVGSHYLLITRSFPAKGWNTLVGRYGGHEIEVGGKGIDPVTTDAAVALRARFEDAVENEVPFDANSYQAGRDPPPSR